MHSITPIAETDLLVVYTTADDGVKCLYILTAEEVTNAKDFRTLQQLGLDRDPDDTRATRTKVSIR